MRVALIGAGNLATNLGKALIRAEHEVVQVWSRTEESAGALAMVLKCSWTTNLEEVVKNADVFILDWKLKSGQADSPVPALLSKLINRDSFPWINHR